MTAELPPIAKVCCVKECAARSTHQICLKLWAVSDPEHLTKPAQMLTCLAVCDEHRANPTHTATEFFMPKTREIMCRSFLSSGKSLPNFDTAEWDFRPLAGAES